MRQLRKLGVLLMFVSVSSLTACGGNDEQDLPADAAAKVGDQTITASMVDEALVGREALAHFGKQRPAYRPDDVEGCTDALSEDAGEQALSDEQARKRCEALRDRKRAAALQVLIRGRWYALDARRRGLRVPEDILLTLKTYKANVSQQSGVKPADLDGVMKADIFRSVVLQRALSQPTNFPRQQVMKYFQAHRERYALPPRRFLDALVVPARPLARRVAAEFRRGATSAALMEDLADDGVTRPYAGNLQDSTDNVRVGLRRLVLTLDPGAVDMVKDPGGWYVFHVVRTSPRRESNVREAERHVIRDLTIRRDRAIVGTYHRRLRASYGDATLCADGYELEECG